MSILFTMFYTAVMTFVCTKVTEHVPTDANNR